MKVTRFLFFCIVALIAAGISTRAQERSVQNENRQADAAGNGNLQGVLDKLATYHETYPREKVYLHLDKPYYAVGDDIWFKVYVTVGSQNLLSAMSGIVNVDLIGPDNQLVRSLRLPVVFGLSMGDFRLTDSLRAGGLREGNYRMRAYTNWMRNFDQDGFFDKTIPVGNVLTDKLITYTDFSYDQRNLLADIMITELGGRSVTNREISYELEADGRRVARGKATTDQQGKIYLSLPGKLPDDPTSGRIRLDIAANETHAAIPKIIPVQYAGQQPAIRFFPESGSLLAGVTGKVGFKALQPNGKGITAQGYIADNNGQRVTEFQTGYAGMGHLLLTPQAGKTYTAHVSFADSSTTEVALPAVLTSGYALSVNNTNDQAVFLKTATTAGQANGQTLALIAQKDGKVCYTATLRQNKPEMAFRIERQGLPAGVIQLTLLNEQLRPVAERIIFNLNPKDTLPVTLVTDKATYKPREKVIVQLTAGTTGDSLRVGSFSVAVTDLRKVTDSDSTEGNILSGLLLSPELKGYIETPGYYFRGMDAAKKQQLDNLMLTQGWRRISWNDLTAGNLPKIRFQPEKSMRISGRVIKKTGTPAPNASLTLRSLTDMNIMLDTLADEKGRFNFDRLALYDSTQLVIQARNQKDKQNVDILLDKVPEQPIGKNKNAPDVTPDINRSMSDYLKSRKEHFDELQELGLMARGNLLDEVTITANKKPVVRNSANPMGAELADQVIFGKDLTNCQGLDICLRARLRSVMIRGGKAFLTRSGPTFDLKPPGGGNGPGEGNEKEMLVLVDGMQVLDLNAVKPQDVEAIELITRPEYLHLFSDKSENGGKPYGVIVITTKYAAGNFRDMHVPGIVAHTPHGFYASREFYTPDYSRPQEHPELRDLRSTIFWGPGVTTDDLGQAYFDFYTADQPGRYRIVAEGIDAAGRVARSVSYINVATHQTEETVSQEVFPREAVAHLQDRLMAYWSEHPPGNLYLHLDKNTYAPQETIWLKAYVLSDTIADNRVLYVRLADERRNIVLSGQFPMYDVRAHGNLELPERLKEGKYTLYAYTDRMMRLADTNAFVQPLHIRKQTGRRLEAEAFVSDTTRLVRREKVSVTARLRDMDAPASGVTGEYQLVAGGQEIRYGRLTTNHTGEATIDFVYPKIADHESLEVKMLFRSGDDHAELSLLLLHEGAPLHIQISPEGGRLVSGIPSRVAVDVLDVQGNPVAAVVQVLDDGQVVGEAATNKQGIAHVRFTPREGVLYMAEVKAGRRVERIPFPEGVSGQGYSLRLLYDGGRTEAVIVNRGGPADVRLVLRSRMAIQWNRELRMAAGDSIQVEIPAADKGKEVLSLGLFDGDHRLLAERLFLNTAEDYRVSVTTDEQVYGKRKKVTVRLRVTDGQGKPVAANVSVAAAEKYRTDSAGHRSIVEVWRYNHFGQRYQQRLMAAARDIDANASLDALLLSANWPGSGWKNISEYTPRGQLPQLPYTDGAYGKVIPEYDKTIPKKQQRPIHKIYLQSVQPNPDTSAAPKDTLLLYRLPVKLESDSTFYVPASVLRAYRGEEWTMDIYEVPQEYKTKFSVVWRDPDIRFDSLIVQSTLLRNHTDSYSRAKTEPLPLLAYFTFEGINALAEVVIGAKEKEVRAFQYDCPDRICDACGLLNCPIRPRDRPVKGGTYVYDREKVLGRRNPLGEFPDGIKVRYLGCGYYRNVDYIKNIVIPDAFPLPDYDQEEPGPEDFRSTIFWDPNIATDGKGEAVFSFFTPDITGEYTVTVQGLDINTRRPLTGKGSFTVN